MTLKINLPFPIQYSKNEHKWKFDSNNSFRLYQIISPFMKFHPQAASIDTVVSLGSEIFSSTHNVVKSVKEHRAKKARRKTPPPPPPRVSPLLRLLPVRQNKGPPPPVPPREFTVTTIDNVPIAVLKLAGTITIISVQIINARVGLITVTTISLLGSVKDVAVALKNKELRKFLEALAKSLGSGCYLAAQIYGGPEIVLASLTLRCLLTFYSALKEFKNEDHIIEGVAKLILASVYAYQLQPHVQLVHRKWTILSSPEFAQLSLHIKTAARIHSPLDNIKKSIGDRMIVIKDKVLGTINLGAHFGNTGGSLVKGANVSARTKIIDGKPITEVEFKLTHVEREHLQKLITDLEVVPKDKLSEFLKFSGLNNSGISIKQAPYEYLPSKDGEYTHKGAQTIGNAYEISIHGVGKMIIGKDQDALTLYDRVIVRLDDQKESSDLKNMLAVVGLENAVKPSTQEEIERLKIAMLYDTYYPTEATKLTREEKFFTTPLDALKNQIVARTPGMKAHFENDLPRMEPIETLPGRIRYSIPDLAKQAKDMGAVALMAGITTYDSQQAFQRVASMLTSGALSSQMRYDAGLLISGDSSHTDHYMGSADEVFTRIITKNCFKGYISSVPFFDRPVKVIYSLKALETGTYQYNNDEYGTKHGSTYLYRWNIFNMIKQNVFQFSHGNEVMIKEAIAPKYIVGCVVDSQSSKQGLINTLAANNLISTKQGVQYVNDMPVDEFIKVGNTFSHDLLKNATKNL